MPERDWQLFLRDIMTCIERIGTYVSGLDHKDFFADQKTIDAVMRNLEVIGEAAKKLPENIPMWNGANWPVYGIFSSTIILALMKISSGMCWPTKFLK